MPTKDSDLATMVLENNKADKIFMLALKLPRGEISNRAFLRGVELILHEPELTEELQAWREVGKLLAEADPMHPETSPALARTHVLGILSANSSLRDDVNRLKDELVRKAMASELLSLTLKRAQLFIGAQSHKKTCPKSSNQKSDHPCNCGIDRILGLQPEKSEI